MYSPFHAIPRTSGCSAEDRLTFFEIADAAATGQACLQAAGQYGMT
jgi:hypothetical protein